MAGALLDMVGRVGEADGDEEEDGVLIDMRLIRWMGRGNREVLVASCPSRAVRLPSCVRQCCQRWFGRE